jgi:hypothetical protein
MTNPDSNQPSSSSTVGTDRPGRYGRQLAAHLGRRVESSWDDDANAGRVTFPFGYARIVAAEDGLRLYVEVAPDAEPELQGDAGLDRLEDVVGRHLVRFGARDELTVVWTRSTGTPGSTQMGAGETQ